MAQKSKKAKGKKNLPATKPTAEVAKKKAGAISLKGTSMKDFKGLSKDVADNFDVDDNIKGVKGRLPQIKIAHQVNLFQDATGDTFKEFEGIILHHTASNAFWMKSFDETGGGELPECFSMDAVNPDGESIQNSTCVDCPKNAFKSAPDGGRGKACKNMWRLHILIDGQIIPKRLTVPPSNLGAIQEFLIGLRDKNIPHELAVIKFTLKPAKNKDSIAFSMLNMEIVSVIEDVPTAKAIKETIESFAASFGQAIVADEMNAEGEGK